MPASFFWQYRIKNPPDEPRSEQRPEQTGNKIALRAFMGRKNFINHTEFPYHLYARCINRDWFSNDMDKMWELMTRNLYFMHLAFNVRIHAFVMMSNHFHLIAATPDGNLSQAMQYFMRETSREITFQAKRINQTYGSRFHRSLIASPLYYLHAYKYLYRNPVAAGICKRVEDYPYSTLPALLGNTRMEIPILDDHNWGSITQRELTLSWLNTAPSSDNWEDVRKALRKGVFRLPRRDSRSSPLEDCAL
ncbi:transposase [Bdellovibrio sp. 22V]|uniref:transposase n=1 Tax=Bdellovibrio sp. 22V TaxID=3044166 RepID=UPI002542B031|nr:transposase [Bdellovibrio sp. 22V]WII70731.1 transposase [Bdellovibrio sp. 22V]